MLREVHEEKTEAEGSQTDSSLKTTLSPIQISRDNVKGADEYQRKTRLLARAQHWVFPFGSCGFNSPCRLFPIAEYRPWAAHLLKVPYLAEKIDPLTKQKTSHVINPFQEPLFLFYSHNRVHRHKFHDSSWVWINKQADPIMRARDFTAADLLAMEAKYRTKIIKNAALKMSGMKGDPARLKTMSMNMKDFVIDRECASAFETASFNDHNLRDMHRWQVLNYSTCLQEYIYYPMLSDSNN